MTRQRLRWLPWIRLGCMCIAMGLPSCDGKGESGASGGSAGGDSTVRVTPAARVEAHGVFKTICVTCHGESGHGDGPGAAGMDPKPRTFADPEWQASVTDDHIKKVIVYGGASVGKSATMTGQPQLKNKPEVLQALVERIRRFKAD